MVVDAGEEWGPILGYEGYYEASTLGGVRSILRIVYQKSPWSDALVAHTKPSVILKPWPGPLPTKRPMVTLSKGGRSKNIYVHTAVALAFLGPKPHAKSQCCHSDGNAFNNVLTNLYWGDGHTNAQDCLGHGTHGKVSMTECPYGHRLEMPNLTGAKRSRRCRACHNSHSWATYRKSAGENITEADRLTYADRQYAKFLIEEASCYA